MRPNTFDIKKNFVEEGQKLAAAENSSFLKEYREKQLSFLKKSTFPHKKMEEWRFTPIEESFPSHYHSVSNNVKTLHKSDIQEYIDYNHELPLVFVNGIFSQDLSFNDHDGIRIWDLKDISNFDTSDFNYLLNIPFTTNEKFFVKLNETFINNGILIKLENKKEISKTIHILHITTDEAEGTLKQPRHIVWAKKLSKAKVLESYVSLGNENLHYTSNYLTDIIIEEGASVDYHKVQNESPNALHIHHLRSLCSRDSNLKLFSYNAGSKLSRNDYEIKIDGPGAHCDTNGLTVLKDKQQSDSYVIVNHEKEHTTSEQYFKYILSDEGHGVFDGKILIARGSKNVEAGQLNKNLLLSKKAHIDTKPRLEVYNDDVKCQHGATIGQLSDEELFYLQSRGLDPHQASSLLSYAFAFDVINKISDEQIKDKISKIFEHDFKVEDINE